MQLKQLRVENYRRFKSAQVEFGKITLLLGPNSSGKTALMNAMLSILQSDQFPIYLNPNGLLVETGDFCEISHRHSRRDEVALSVVYVDKEEKAGSATEIEVGGRFGHDIRTKMPSLTSARARGGAMAVDVVKLRSKYRMSWQYDKSKDEALKLGKELPEFLNFLERMHKDLSKGPPGSQKDRSFGDSAASAGVIEGGVDRMLSASGFPSPWHQVSLAGALSTSTKFRKNFSYLGSHRTPPQRTYFNSVGGDLSVGVHGENAIEQVIDWSIRDPKRVDRLVKVLSRIGLASKLRAYKLAGGRVELRVTTSKRGAAASITDVGFGVNQFMPIAVAELQLPDGSTIAVSQPETHLHPSAQAEASEHFANCVKERRFRYILETHSEYMVNRIRRLIVRGDLGVEDVAAYYVSPLSDGTSKLIRMRFLKNGVIENAPEEFFETYQTDVLGIALKE